MVFQVALLPLSMDDGRGRGGVEEEGRSWTHLLSRCCTVTLVVLVVTWVNRLGGLALTPVATTDGNDTSQLFNWHPLLMTLAFGVAMAEAVSAYRAPPASWLQR